MAVEMVVIIVLLSCCFIAVFCVAEYVEVVYNRKSAETRRSPGCGARPSSAANSVSVFMCLCSVHNSSLQYFSGINLHAEMFIQ